MVAGKYEADGSRPADERFRKQASQLRPPTFVVCGGTRVVAFALLVARCRVVASCGRLQSFRTQAARFSYPRSLGDRCGNAYLFACAYSARRRIAAGAREARPVSLRRRSRICRRNSIGCNRRRAVCRSGRRARRHVGEMEGRGAPVSIQKLQCGKKSCRNDLKKKFFRVIVLQEYLLLPKNQGLTCLFDIICS